MTPLYRPFPPSRRPRLAALLEQSSARFAKEGGADLDHLAELRTALTGRPAPQHALRTLAAG